MTTTISRALVALALAAIAAGCNQNADAQSGGAPVAFKVGTFERGGQPFVGLVLKDTQAVDIGPANAAYERANASAPKLTIPGDMKQLIANYDTAWKGRLAAIAKDVSTSKTAPSYAYAVDTLTILPPVRPSVILNAGGNYVEHTEGIAAQQQRAGAAPEQASQATSAPGIWERKPTKARRTGGFIAA